MKTELIKITPERAQALLDKNPSNRRISDRRVNQYAKFMRNGEWLSNGETIKISVNGKLLDGQHRLLAVIMYGLPVEFLMVSGLPEEIFTTIDTGKARNSADCFYIEGIQNARNMASIVSKHMNLVKGIDSQKLLGGNTEILDTYNKRQDYYQNLCRFSETFYAKTFGILPPSEIGGFYAFFNDKYPEDVVDNFFDSIIEHNDGIGKLVFDKFLSNKIGKKKMPLKERSALLIKAFNFHITGKTTKILKFSIDESFPELV